MHFLIFSSVLRFNITTVGPCLTCTGCTARRTTSTVGLSKAFITLISPRAVLLCHNTNFPLVLPIQNWRSPSSRETPGCRPTPCVLFRNRVSVVTDTGIVRPRPAIPLPRDPISPSRASGGRHSFLERTTKYERKTRRKAIPRCCRPRTLAR